MPIVSVVCVKFHNSLATFISSSPRNVTVLQNENYHCYITRFCYNLLIWEIQTPTKETLVLSKRAVTPAPQTVYFNEMCLFLFLCCVWGNWILHYKCVQGKYETRGCVWTQHVFIFVCVCCFIKFSVNTRAGLLSNCLDSAASCIFTEKRSLCSRTPFLLKRIERLSRCCCALGERCHNRKRKRSLSFALSRPHADIICYDFMTGLKGFVGKRRPLSLLLSHAQTHTGRGK